MLFASTSYVSLIHSDLSTSSVHGGQLPQNFSRPYDIVLLHLYVELGIDTSYNKIELSCVTSNQSLSTMLLNLHLVCHPPGGSATAPKHPNSRLSSHRNPLHKL